MNSKFLDRRQYLNLVKMVSCLNHMKRFILIQVLKPWEQ